MMIRVTGFLLFYDILVDAVSFLLLVKNLKSVLSLDCRVGQFENVQFFSSYFNLLLSPNL